MAYNIYTENKQNQPQKGEHHHEKTLFEKSLKTSLASRFIARADDLNRDLTDEEVRAEAQYQLDDIPFKGMEPDEEKQATREMKRLLQ